VPTPSVGAPTTPPSEKKSRVGLWAAPGVLLLLVVGAAGVAVLDGGGGSDESDEGIARDEVVAPTTTAPATTTVPETSLPNVPRTVAELAKSTVMVVLVDSSDVPVCFGSGTVVDPDGTILTNAHVVAKDSSCPYERIIIAVTDDSGVPPVFAYQADLLAVDVDLDLAVVRAARDLGGVAAAGSFVATAIGDSDAVQIGDSLRILGYPSIGGDTITFTNGSVSGFTSQVGIGARSWIKTDATIAGGNSGGTAVNNASELIGIPTQGGASNESPVVDCRVLTDTNGDGLVDDTDQCVPFGGFLNGIRPVNLALPLLEAARVASPITFTPAEPPADFNLDELFFYLPAFSLGVPEDSVTTDFVVTASSADTDLCFWFAWSGMVDGVSWDSVWLVDDQIVDEYSFFDQVWDVGPAGTDFWVCASNEAGFVAGLYEIAFLVDGERFFVESIEVTEEPVPVHEVTFVNETGEEACYVTINPTGSADIGLGELGEDEVLASGDQRPFLLPEGVFDVQVYNCDIELIAADLDSIAVGGDMVVSMRP
jgi:S1-C subfamily serine protease